MLFSKASRIENIADKLTVDMARLKKLVNQSHLLEEILKNKKSKPSEIRISMEGDGVRDLAISTIMKFKLEDIAGPLGELLLVIDNEIEVITSKHHPVFFSKY
jgi:hypothetical protein